jgi:hypothetical protein
MTKLDSQNKWEDDIIFWQRKEREMKKNNKVHRNLTTSLTGTHITPLNKGC